MPRLRREGRDWRPVLKLEDQDYAELDPAYAAKIKPETVLRRDLPGAQGYIELAQGAELPEQRGTFTRLAPGEPILGPTPTVTEEEKRRAHLVDIKYGTVRAKTEEEKDSRRQHLIRQAARHNVPPQVLAQQIEVEGIGEVAGKPRQILKDIAGEQRFVDTGGRVFPEAKKAEGAGEAEVQSSKILPGGLVQLVRKDGTVDIVPATKANQMLVKEAETRGAALQGLRAGERAGAKSSMKLGVDSFKKLEPISKNIRNMEEAIRLIDAGAETGPIAKRFPSIRAASVELQNVQDKLGLDVIANTTFGALSESELAFALDSALPIGLNAPELKDWLTRKRDTQVKLADYLRESAIFLTTPGNTIAKFMDEKRGAAGGDDLTPEEQAELNELKKRFQ